MFATRGATRGVRGFSFGDTFIGEGTVHSSGDSFYTETEFRFRMAAI